MAEPFEARPERRLRSRKRAFLAELETELAKPIRVTLLDPTRVLELARERGINLERDVATARRGMYRRFLEFCLNDHALSEDESEDLAHLQKLLRLRDADVQAVYSDVLRSVYGQAIDEVLEDYRLDPEEEAFLQRLQVQIGLSDDVAAKLKEEGRERARSRFVSRAAVHTSSFVASQGAEIELKGNSEKSFEEAVQAAIAAASDVKTIESAELKTLRVDVSEGRVRRWSVKLTTRL